MRFSHLKLCWYPGVHQEKCGQQAKRSDPAPLDCSSEATSAVLCPAGLPSARKTRSYRRGFRRGHRDDLGSGVSLV